MWPGGLDCVKGVEGGSGVFLLLFFLPPVVAVVVIKTKETARPLEHTWFFHLLKMSVVFGYFPSWF